MITPLNWDSESMLEELKKAMREGLWQQAIPVAERLGRLLPESIVPHRALGIAWYNLNDLSNSERSFREAIQRGDETAIPRVFLARIAGAQGKFAQQMEWAQEAWSRDPADEEASILFFDAGRLLGRKHDVMATAQRILDRHPQNTEGRPQRAGLYLNEQRLEDAARELHTAVRMDEEDSSLWADLGHVLARQTKYHAALAAFRKALDLDSESAMRHYNVGDTLLALDQYEEAATHLRRATELDDDMYLAHYSLSSALLGLDQHDEAAAAAQQALRNDPEMETVQTNLGVGAMTNWGLARMRQRHFKEAEIPFRKLLAFFAPTYFHLGLVLFKSGRHVESLAMFEHALVLRPDEPEYLDLLGNALMEIGRLDEAETAFRKAIAGDPDDGRNHYDLGVVLGRMPGRAAEAIAPLKRSIPLLTEDGLLHPHYALASVYALLGDEVQALSHLQYALEHGFKDWAWIDGDSDWDTFRKDKRFINLVARYRQKK